MEEAQNTRRKFLKIIGITAGASLTGSLVKGSQINLQEIHKLNPEQKEFMLLYEKWMDEFIEVIKKQKLSPDDIENHKKMIALSEVAAEWQEQLLEYMKDEKFSLIYQASIERMKEHI